MPNPFGGDVFGAMWEAVEEDAERRADEALKIMKNVIHKKTSALSDAAEKEKIGDADFLVGINEGKLVADERNAGTMFRLTTMDRSRISSAQKTVRRFIGW